MSVCVERWISVCKTDRLVDFNVYILIDINTLRFLVDTHVIVDKHYYMELWLIRFFHDLIANIKAIVRNSGKTVTYTYTIKQRSMTVLRSFSSTQDRLHQA